MLRRDFHLRLAGALAFGVPLAGCAQPPRPASAAVTRTDVARTVDAVMQPLLQAHGIPGLSVGVRAGGERHFFYYGVASRESGRRVTATTLFEVGSISKVFTAVLGAHAQAAGALAWGDSASRHWDALRGSRVDTVTLLQLATYTAGGLPLQVPDAVKDIDQALAWYRAWQPAHAPGVYRQYSNASIGLFGHLVARSLGQPFSVAMQRDVLAPLGLASTYLTVPASREADYAWGERDGKPVRVSPGVWDAEAYGVKTTAADLLRLIEVHLDPRGVPAPLAQAFAAAQTGYFRVGGMTQGLGWEMYDAPWPLETLLAGNSADMALKAQAATPLQPPRPLREDAWVNKTGATNGFGAYAAFVPAQRLGIVMLANKNYPNAARVQAAHAVLTALAPTGTAPR